MQQGIKPEEINTMNTVRDFSYKGIDCSIIYNNETKNYMLYSYIKGKADNAVTLFPSSRNTDNQTSIAFHVANLHILPTWY